MWRKILAVFMLNLVMLLSASCSRGARIARSMYNDREAANAVFDQLLASLESRDEAAVRALFSKTATADEQFEANLTALIELYQGELVSYDDGAGPNVSEGRHPTRKYKLFRASYDVVTSEQEYRFALMIYVKDTETPDNVGIYCLYVIKAEDDPEREFTYWGNGNWAPGIAIETKRET